MKSGNTQIGTKFLARDAENSPCVNVRAFCAQLERAHDMLIVTRKTDESITIEPLDGVDPEMTLGEVFRNGPIEVKVIRINRRWDR
jgi:hypothetical protein